jgi:ADP-heptose:LPS heptosyltransferase
MPLLAGNPLVDRVLVTGHAAVATLMVERFDLVLGLDNDHPSATLAALARAGERRGFTVDADGRVVPANDGARRWWLTGLDDGRKRANRRTHADFMYEVCELDGPASRPQLAVDAEAASAAAHIAASMGIDHAPTPVALCIASGGRWEEKRWKARHAAALLDLLPTRLPGVTPFLLGGPQDADFNANVAALAGRAVPHAGGPQPLPVFAALLARASAVVTTDSLPLHVAVALGVPAVAVVGPTSPWEIATAGVEIVATERPCAACYLERCPHAITCMDDLSPERVLAGLTRVLAGCA